MRERRSGRDRRRNPPITTGQIATIAGFAIWAAILTVACGTLLGLVTFAIIDVLIGGSAMQVLSG